MSGERTYRERSTTPRRHDDQTSNFNRHSLDKLLKAALELREALALPAHESDDRLAVLESTMWLEDL